MSDLISKSALIAEINKTMKEYEDCAMVPSIFSVTELIANQPEVESVPVVHGEWMYNGIPESALRKCSVCGCFYGSDGFNFCPQCGADMRKKVDE